MRNNLKIWLKQEKRIVKLLYKKGFLEDFGSHHKNLYWESYKNIPEIYSVSFDYYGEAIERSLIDSCIENLYWENAIMDEDWDQESFPVSTFKEGKTRKMFIKYLSSLPTKVSNSKINKVLKQDFNFL